MTIVTTGDDWVIEQITKQLNKLIDVIKVTDMTELDHVEREMVLLKVSPKQENKAEVLNLTEIFRGRIVDSSQKTYTIEITGNEKKIEAFVELMRPMGIKEFVRTGKVAITREGVKRNKSEILFQYRPAQLRHCLADDLVGSCYVERYSNEFFVFDTLGQRKHKKFQGRNKGILSCHVRVSGGGGLSVVGQG